MKKTFTSRRRFPRFKVPPRFRVKARIRFMGQTVTHYFSVKNLSMGGAGLVSHKGVPLAQDRGDTLEVLIYGGNLSLRCVARLIPCTFEGDKCVKAGIEIVGIDESSRKILADFIERLSHDTAEDEGTILISAGNQ